MTRILLFATSLLAGINLVAGHGLIFRIAGANGAASAGFAVANVAAPVRADVATIRGNTACGNSGRGNINIAAGLSAAERAGLPKIAGDGTLAMTWLQLNAGNDGGGPGTAFIDTTGTGNSFKAVTISKNFGDRGANSNNDMTIKLDTKTVCTGGSGATCLLKVVNSAGPFGSCFAVASPARAAGNIAVAVPRAAVAATAPVANNAMNNRNNNTTGNVNVNAGTAVRNSGTSAGNNAAKTKTGNGRRGRGGCGGRQQGRRGGKMARKVRKTKQH